MRLYVLKVGAAVLGSLAVIVTGLYLYYVYVPEPAPPVLRGKIAARVLDIGGRSRTMLVYVPPGLARAAPLILALHGSQSDPEGMRRTTGYELDRLADQQGFAVAYPAGIGGAWNDCRREAPFEAKRLNVDDVGFLRSVIDTMHASAGIARDRVFVVGYSNGAQMAFRMIFDVPGTLAGAALFGGNLPEPANMACATTRPTPPVMLVSGTADPLVPFEGGNASLFGLASRGKVVSSNETFATLAQANGLSPDAAKTSILPHMSDDDPTSVRLRLIEQDDRPFLALYVVEGGGHVVPQQTTRVPRLLGPVTGDLNGPAVAVSFFLGTAQ